MKEILRQIKHRVHLLQHLISAKQTNLDYLGEAFISLSSRWHAELDPMLSYAGMFDYLRQRKFSGEMLELGGGYSTVLLRNMFHDHDLNISSVDLNSGKYDRILNSKTNRERFLSKINSISELTVTIDEVNSGIKDLQKKLNSFDQDRVKESLLHYISGPDAVEMCDEICREIFSNDSNALNNILAKHPNYDADLKFYRLFNPESESFCGRESNSTKQYDAIFFDCGEVSSIGEWFLMQDKVKIGGYALFHDIYFPKSIKNFLVVTHLSLCRNWEIVYTDEISQQGALLAKRLS